MNPSDIFFYICIFGVSFGLCYWWHSTEQRKSRQRVLKQVLAERLKLEREESKVRAQRNKDMLTSAPVVELVYKKYDYDGYEYHDWPESNKGKAGVIYYVKSELGMSSSSYIWEDGIFYRVEWILSEEEQKETAKTNRLINFRKKSTNLYNWRHARHLRRH